LANSEKKLRYSKKSVSKQQTLIISIMQAAIGIVPKEGLVMRELTAITWKDQNTLIEQSQYI